MIAPGGLLLTDPMAELIRRPQLDYDATRAQSDV